MLAQRVTGVSARAGGREEKYSCSISSSEPSRYGCAPPRGASTSISRSEAVPGTSVLPSLASEADCLKQSGGGSRSTHNIIASALYVGHHAFMYVRFFDGFYEGDMAGRGHLPTSTLTNKFSH